MARLTYLQAVQALVSAVEASPECQSREVRQALYDLRTAVVKRCGTCGEVKPLEDFNRDRSQADGRQVRCKPCHRKRSAQWVKDYPEKEKARTERWKRENPEKHAGASRSEAGGCAGAAYEARSLRAVRREGCST